MNDAARAVLLVGMGSVGLYYIGRAAIESKMIDRRGGGKYDNLRDDRETEDIVAFLGAMSMVGVALWSVPALLDTVHARQIPEAPVKVLPT